MAINLLKFRRRLFQFSSVSALGLFLSACSISEAVHVRKGIDPQHADDLVRFRTTYYFRSVDICEGPASQNISGNQFENYFGPASDQVFIRKQNIQRVLKDTLYRFTMTGKSSPNSDVRFESGTLKSWHIDPFGANVAFDNENNRFYWKSQASVQRDAAYSETVKEIERLKELRADFADPDEGGSENALAEIDRLILSRIKEIGSSQGSTQQPLPLIQSIAASLRKTSNDHVDQLNQLATTLGFKPDEIREAQTQGLETDPKAQKIKVMTDLNAQINEVGQDLTYLQKVQIAAQSAYETAQKAYDMARQAAQKKTPTISEDMPAISPAKPATVSPPTPLDGQTLGVPNAGAAALAPPAAPTAEALKKEFEGALENLKKASQAVQETQTALNSLKFYLNQLLATDLAELTPDQTGSCAPGSEFKRGFQLIGPEGVKTFDQDDRLVMAMSTSAEPVLGVLQELSGRLLKKDPPPAEKMLPLVQEQLHLQNVQKNLSLIENASNDELEIQLNQLISALEGE